MAVSIQASARVRQVSQGTAETTPEVAGLRIGMVGRALLALVALSLLERRRQRPVAQVVANAR